jgi:type-F conjugative transfer system pilin assembly protein TrbC
VRRCSLLPAWLLSLAAWGAPPGLPDEGAIQAEMARQKARGELLMRRAEESFQADPGRPMQSTPRVAKPGASPGTGADPLAVAQRYRQTRPAVLSTGPDLLVFVSFAIPRASLERLAADAARTGAVMVFRGPKEGSLRKTLQAFEPLARRGASAILHPEAFTRHRIEAVPAYVLGNSGGCQADSNETACQDVLRISGDASLDFILERMARADHPLAAVAEARLARLRGKP